MSKNKNKKLSKSEGTVSEPAVLKALNELEVFAKGNALEDADTEGGLSTEGKPLSAKAPRGKVTEVNKGGKPPVDDESDEGSEEESEDDESGADDESEDVPMGKSLAQRAGDDEDVAKGVDVSPFLEALVDQISNTLEDVRGTLKQSINKSISESTAAQQEFNIRLAKGIVTIGKGLQSLSTQVSQLTESLQGLNTAPAGVRKSVLSQNEIVEPRGDEGDEDTGANSPFHHSAVEDWLVQKSQEGQVPIQIITMWESSGRQLHSLPPNIRKACVQDLRKS